MHAVWAKTVRVLVKLAGTFLGKIIALLGAVSLVAAFGALATSDSAGSRLLHFFWIFSVGIFLIVTGRLLMRKNKNRM
jgi:hypothetical protein